MKDDEKSRARQYAPSTVRRLDTLSGNQCYRPGCSRHLVATDARTITSAICHIEAASLNGPRWNPDMTDDERRHFDNLILLCDECHRMVDNKENEADYPVAVLKGWKKRHEQTMTYAILVERPTMLSAVVDAIADVDLEPGGQDSPEALESFRIEAKIEHNRVKRNRVLIDEYKVFYTKLNALYEAMEQQGSFKKERLLRNIRNVYVKTKKRYVGSADNPLEVIQENADNIIDDVLDELQALAEASNQAQQEDLAFGVSIVMVDAFIRCRILEPPPMQ